MAGDQHNPGASTKDGVAPGTAGAADAAVVDLTARSPWANLWQLPAILMSVGLIWLGIRGAIKPKPPNDFAGALAQVEKFLSEGELQPADTQLRKVIEPNLAQATGEQQAHFHALVADYLFASQFKDEKLPEPASHAIVEQYAKAEELGRELSPLQVERSAEALLTGGDLSGARTRLSELDRRLEQVAGGATGTKPAAEPAPHEPAASGHGQAENPSGSSHDGGHDAGHDATHDAGHKSGHEASAASPVDIAASRNRLFRRVVAYSMAQPSFPADELMKMLAEYRGRDMLPVTDELWAVARQAELRLAAGQTQRAVDVLLIDMRRQESHEGPETKAGFGELYTLLGRAYFQLGQTAKAEAHLQHALNLFNGPEPVRGEALVILGQIAMANSDPEGAIEKFQVVVRDFIGTQSFLPGLLGRAEAQSVLGDHAASQEDYRQLGEMLPKAGERRDVNPRRVAASLCDRHDAALALGRLDLALGYAEIAQGLFPPERVPLDVVIRLASVHRQMADNVIAAAQGSETGLLPGEPVEIDPGARHDANLHYEKAGDLYLRHTQAESETPLSEPQWAESLWMAADSYDLGGRQDLAIPQFRKYVDVRPNEDPRRAETLYRIAQAQHALLEYEKAIATYEVILAEQPRSTFAARSHVPLARCYMAVNRRADAEHELRSVLSGEALLKPDAADYRDALLELGRIDHDAGAFPAAIESLTQAHERYPDDPQRLEITYLLADSYRGNALAIGDSAAQDSMLSPADSDRLGVLRTTHLQTALELFGTICDAQLAGAASVSSSPYQRDLLRRAEFYRADCAFHLGQYEQAVQYYDRASRAYSSHQSSLYALIQIVNCYSALGDRERAAAAHHRALLRLRQLPDTAFAEPDGVMDRAAWERWLDNTPVAPAGAAASAAGG